jgi:hypothetical protein
VADFLGYGNAPSNVIRGEGFIDNVAEGLTCERNRLYEVHCCEACSLQGSVYPIQKTSQIK